MRRSLDPAALADAEAALRDANLAFARRYPGERGDGARQPVHTLIEGLRALDAHAPDAESLGTALGADASDAVYGRLRERLRREPVEDYRVDFEDGYGARSDED